ncbi:MAG: Y-family DNA polymerase [Desulfurivibrio sp.]|nr:Y-family DNA polymerase [Desulfurivibrio sp.]
MKPIGVRVFSSNYPLYGDISSRVMSVLARLEPELEIYSIDEAFIRLPAAGPAALRAMGGQIRATIGQEIGIPVSIGFGATKTLAKIANRIAKQQPEHGGVFAPPEHGLDDLLSTVDAGEVWGIGGQAAAKLSLRGIRTALELKNADDDWLRKQLTITGLRTANELRGVCCLPLEENPPPSKSITTSRSFGRPVRELTELQEALATYVSIATEKLRAQGLKAGGMQVFLTTNRFHHHAPQYANSAVATMPQPSSSTPELLAYAGGILAKLFRAGYTYQKVGVILLELTAANHVQPSLFQPPRPDHDEALMRAMDKINQKWGRETLHSAATGFQKDWKNRQCRKSPAYTTSWHELPVVG